MFEVLIQDYCNFNASQTPLKAESRLHPTMKSSGCEIFQLSIPESRRLHRAFWRWQIYSKVFGGYSADEPNAQGALGPVPGPDESMYDDHEIAEIFLGLFPMHEVEELGCLRSYATHLHKKYNATPYLDQFVTLGPELLYHMLQAPFGPERYDLLASRNLYYEVTMKEAIDAYERVVDQGSWPWKGRNEPLTGEREPNEGWRWASSRGVENTDFKLRRWGYVFWDRKRLDEWGITREHMLNWPGSRT